MYFAFLNGTGWLKKLIYDSLYLTIFINTIGTQKSLMDLPSKIFCISIIHIYLVIQKTFILNLQLFIFNFANKIHNSLKKNSL